MTDIDLLIERAVRFAESGAAPVPPRLAATVMLLRPAETPAASLASLDRSDAIAGFEVFLQRRAAGLAFAAGMYAYPGGAVEPEDHGAPVAGAGWSARLGRPAVEAAAVVRAAARELWEETGVRANGRDLVPWARWITPEFEPRRYDTYFFAAALPDGQRPVEAAGESDRSVWIRPADGVALPMLPPTAATLAQLAEFGAISEVLAAGRDAATPVLPRVEPGPDGSLRFVY